MPAFLKVMNDHLRLGSEGNWQETLSEFSAQLKLLTDKDRMDLYKYAIEAGIACDPPKLSGDGTVPMPA